MEPPRESSPTRMPSTKAKTPKRMTARAAQVRRARRSAALRSASVKARKEFVSFIAASGDSVMWSSVAGPERLADGFDEAGSGAEEDSDDVDPVLVQPFVEQYPPAPADEQGDGQD